MTQLSLFQGVWFDAAQSAVVSKLAGREFTADDVHGVVTVPDVDNWIGILFARLRHQGLIERVGSKPSERSSRKGGWVGVYRLKDL